MSRYSVEDMACEHCIATITEAIEKVDREATVTVDLPSKTVAVDGAVDDERVREAIRSAGYEPRALA